MNRACVLLMVSIVTVVRVTVLGDKVKSCVVSPSGSVAVLVQGYLLVS